MPRVAGLIRDGLDWSGPTGRGVFAGVSAVTFAVFLGAVALPPFALAESLAWLLTALLTVPWLGHARRRLRDMGWTGWLMPVLILPVLNIALLGALLLIKGKPGAMPGQPGRFGLILACLVALVPASRIVLHPFDIPAGSMKPVLLPGDYMLTTRWSGAPARGDLAVFTHPVTGQIHVKRIAALPGDSVQMREGRVVLNGQEVAQQDAGSWSEPLGPSGRNASLPRCANRDAVTTRRCDKTLAGEQFPGEAQPHRVLNIMAGPMDNTPVLDVPEGHLVMLGDNRDNSLDSRVSPSAGGLGFVPVDTLLARPIVVLRWGDGIRSFR